MRVICLLVCLMAFALCSNSQGIKFEEKLNWKEIKAKAKSENKYIFIDAFATWCAPCKWMDKNVYGSDTVGDFMNEKFISVKVQMDVSKNDNAAVKEWYADAKNLQKEYKIKEYPSLLFFDPTGKIVHKATGAFSDSGFILLASQSLKRENQYYTLIEAYRNKKLAFSQMPALALEAKKLGESTIAAQIGKDYINNYLYKLKEKDLFVKEHLQFIGYFLTDDDKRGFNLFTRQQEEVNNILGVDKAQYIVRNAIARKYIPKSETWVQHTPNWDSIEAAITTKFASLGQEVIYGRRMIYSSDIKDWDNYGKYYVLYFQKALRRPEWIVNDLSWTVFEKINDPEVLKFATDTVMKYAMEEWYQNDAAAYDTYANLLYKLGRRDDAIKWENSALKLTAGTPNEQVFKDILIKMEKGIPTWTTK